MTCKKCGSALSPNANFCHHCGEKQEIPAWQQPVYGQASAPETQPGDGAQPDNGSAAQPTPNYPAPQHNPYYNPYSRVSPYDAPHIGYAILCFFFPIVGLILYLVWKDEFPRRAKSAGKGALAGVITGVVLSVLAFVIWFGLIFWLISDASYYYGW